ncbi:hypothetical protein [Flavobacterium collinsii]|uniref:Uncharacterized protein n=1 Tax=Flavobacterium collinsii TaxID=1114861 RepID=A0ABN7ER87_9FLAO|nr:hypothetical protein [Flavobacterium collinsii]CAA9203352.1 hypothetical protein FLACOL7796_04701 [Flavobacterium collinsii]
MKIINHSYFARDTEVDKANEEYQIAIKKCLAGEISFEECSKYQEAVFEACNKNNRFLEKVDGVYRVKGKKY